ncbi:hypothetical protein [Deinococcus sp.]|uniref:hypothetical protein n=1 Tax=Deinococcus sp. TaxID=47478 RepID=UPI003C798560
MIQTVYVLEIVRADGMIRGHFAQTQGAAQRAAAGKFHLRAAGRRSQRARWWRGCSPSAQWVRNWPAW